MVSSKTKKNSENKKEKSRNSAVLTIRIDNSLDEIFNQIGEEKRLPKSTIIRDYLEMARYFAINRKSIRSINENDLIILKRNFFFSLLEGMDELHQIELGSRLGHYINDVARIQGKLEDVEYKLDLCEKHGFFQKFLDAENYILVSKKFGPKRFVEAFVWILLTKGEEGDFNRSFTESEMTKSSKTKRSYYDTIQPIKRDASHYSFEFAKIRKEEE